MGGSVLGGKDVGAIEYEVGVMYSGAESVLRRLVGRSREVSLA